MTATALRERDIARTARVFLAIDPGPLESAYCLFQRGVPTGSWKAPNDAVLSMLRQSATCINTVVCERIRSYGMPAGAELFETCEWCGRFQQAWVSVSLRHNWCWVTRIEVKTTLCGSARAKDANVRQAIIDRFGGREKAIGHKAAPGPLYGVSGDRWSAIAVGLAWIEREGQLRPEVTA